MAKFEKYLNGDFDRFLNHVHNTILSKSISATFEDGSDFRQGDLKIAVRVYERYSYLGQNRVSLNVTIVGQGQSLFCSAIASGGSQAMFFKINTFGERGFLNTLANAIDGYQGY